MSIFRSLFGKNNSITHARESKKSVEEPSGQTHFFICSGNASLIESYNGLFRVGATAYDGSFGHYSIDSFKCETRGEEARKASLPFSGQSTMGSKNSPVSNLDEVFRSMRISASRTAVQFLLDSFEKVA
jgi:hypothetical protein